MTFIEARDQTVRAFLLFRLLIEQILLNCAMNKLAQKCIN